MISTSQLVNKLGKYLYRNIDGRETIRFTGNTCDVYITVYYQIPANLQDTSAGSAVNDIQTMLVNINITTYQNKIRVNVITVTPEARTLGFDLYAPEECQVTSTICQKIYSKVCTRIAKAFKEFDFLF